MASQIPGGGIDLLSIDIDGNDYHVWQAVECVKPKVVVIEYNAKFPPDLEWVMPYEETHAWMGTDKHGASLKAFERLGDRLGYSLVATNISGVNAFFVRKDLTQDKFAGPATAETFYNPFRADRIQFANGHPCSSCLKYEKARKIFAENREYKVLIWGTGDVCESLLNKLPDNCMIEAFVETMPDKQEFKGRKVISAESFQEYYDKTDVTIVASTSFADEIEETIETKIGNQENVFFWGTDILEL